MEIFLKAEKVFQLPILMVLVAALFDHNEVFCILGEDTKRAFAIYMLLGIFGVVIYIINVFLKGQLVQGFLLIGTIIYLNTEGGFVCQTGVDFILISLLWVVSIVGSDFLLGLLFKYLSAETT